jgi:hypothetical protein
MSLVEWNYAVGNQEMLAIFMSCHYLHFYIRGARHPVEVLTDHHNFQRFMTTKLFMGCQARWSETLSSDNHNIVCNAGKRNFANAPSHQPDCTKVLEDPIRALEGLCAATVLTVHCNAMFCLRQLYVVDVKEH